MYAPRRILYFMNHLLTCAITRKCMMNKLFDKNPGICCLLLGKFENLFPEICFLHIPLHTLVSHNLRVHL